MAGFDVGNIEGRLTLDRSPFTEGLRLARAQAKRFEQDHIELGVDLADEKARLEIDRLKLELEKLDHTRATPRVDADTSGSRGQIGLLASAIIALGPLALTAGGVAAGALAPLAVGAVGIAAIALPALKELHAAATKTGAAQQKALTELGPGALPAVAAFKQMTAAWAGFRAQMNPALFGLFRQTFGLIQATLPAMLPFVRAFTNAIATLVHGLIPLAPTFGRAFTAMMPIVNMVTQGVLHLAQALARWTQGQGFQHFIAYVVQNGPLLWHTLGAVTRTFVQLGIAAAPLLPVFLHLVTAIAHLLTTILGIPVIGPAIVALAFVGVTAWKVVAGVKGLLNIFNIVKTALPAIFAAISGAFDLLLANPVIAAIAAIGAALYLLVTNWQSVKDFLGNIWQGMLDIYNNTVGLIPGMHAGPSTPTNLQSFADDVQKAQQGDKAAAERLKNRKAGSDFGGGGDFGATPAPPSLAGVTGIIKSDPKKPQTAYEGYNPITNRIESHTSDQWRHIHVVNQKRQHDLAVQRKAHPPAAQTYEGVNPFNNQLEMHTSADWKHIHNLYTQHQRQIAGTGGGRRPQTPTEGFNQTTGRIERHTADEWRHIHVLQQQRAFQHRHPGLTGLPRSVAHGFTRDDVLGGDIVGQTVITHHPRDARKPGGTRDDKIVRQGDTHTRLLQGIHDILKRDDGRPKAHIEVRSKGHDPLTELRRRGKHGAKK